MSLRQKQWAKRSRRKLSLALGGLCAVCRAVDSLCFDLIKPSGPGHHKLDTSARMSFYHAQARRGNVQLLCLHCNSMKSNNNPDVWRLAIRFAAENRFLVRLTRTPGQGNEMTPYEFRESVSEHMSRLRAKARRDAVIKLQQPVA